jgi:serine/threonine protein kinase
MENWDDTISPDKNSAPLFSPLLLPLFLHTPIKLARISTVTCKNILLDSDFKASVSDFGTAKFLKPESSNWSMLAGTCGYVAPGISMHYNFISVFSSYTL